MRNLGNSSALPSATGIKIANKNLMIIVNSGDLEHLKSMMVEAINYKGYALVDILQPCISFNKVNTYKFYKERVYYIDKEHDASNMNAAYRLSLEWGDKIPIGIFLKVNKPDYIDKINYLRDGIPLIEKTFNPSVFESLMDDFR